MARNGKKRKAAKEGFIDLFWFLNKKQKRRGNIRGDFSAKPIKP